MSVSWQQAAVVAAVVGLASYLARPIRWRGQLVAELLRECAILFALYALWQLVLDFTVTSTTGAVSHGRWVWRAERMLHLPSERTVQRGILSHPTLVTLANRYYLLGHYGGLFVCLGWVFIFLPGCCPNWAWWTPPIRIWPTPWPTAFMTPDS
jgi:Zn-dependent protease with chaperone function